VVEDDAPRYWSLEVKILLLVLCGVVFASCSRATGTSPLPFGPANGSPTSDVTPGTIRYKQIFSFDGTDGALPGAALTDVNGVLFGATEIGCAYYSGVVYKIAGGKEHVVYTFGDGAGGLES